MRRKKISGLEYYGFPDQNDYSSSCSDADLNEIIEKNKEQDIEIENLETDKADVSKVDTAISSINSAINQLALSVSKNTSDIAELAEEIGYNETLETQNDYEVAFGEYNVSNTGPTDADKTIFSIGIGKGDDDRKNALEIRKDGSIMMWVEGEFIAINDLLAMLTHETY